MKRLERLLHAGIVAALLSGCATVARDGSANDPLTGAVQGLIAGARASAPCSNPSVCGPFLAITTVWGTLRGMSKWVRQDSQQSDVACRAHEGHPNEPQTDR